MHYIYVVVEHAVHSGNIDRGASAVVYIQYPILHY